MRQILATSIKELPVKFLLFAGIGVIAFLLSEDHASASPTAGVSVDDMTLATGEQCMSVTDFDYKTSLSGAAETDILFVGCGGLF